MQKGVSTSSTASSRCSTAAWGIGRKERQWEHNGLLFASNPVACDRVQLELINAERKRRGLRDLFERHNKPKHVEEAGKAGLGTADLAKINWIKAVEQQE